MITKEYNIYTPSEDTDYSGYGKFHHKLVLEACSLKSEEEVIEWIQLNGTEYTKYLVIPKYTID